MSGSSAANPLTQREHITHHKNRVDAKLVSREAIVRFVVRYSLASSSIVYIAIRLLEILGWASRLVEIVAGPCRCP